MSYPVVYGAPVPLDDHSRDALAAKTLDEDLATLLALGLNLKDVERLWRQNKLVDMADVYASATRVLGGAQPGLPVKREVTVGLEVAGSGAPGGTEVLPELAELLRNELDEPPEHFRDPIMLTLMRDPVVISSGHVLDRSTAYDGARFRFQSCPMSRQHIDQTAFPLVYLKAQLIEFKLKRLDGILAAVQANIPPAEEPTRAALNTLLELAAELFEGLAPSAAAAQQTYHHRAAAFFSCRKRLAPPAELPALLTELAGAARRGAAGAPAPPALVALRVEVEAALREAVGAAWARGEHAAAAALALAGLEALQPALGDAGLEATTAWLALLEGLVAFSDVEPDSAAAAAAAAAHLAPCLPLLPARRLCAASAPLAYSYWRLTLAVSKATGGHQLEEAGAALARVVLLGAAAAPPPPMAGTAPPASSSSSSAVSSPWGGVGVPPVIIARGAGFGAANGVYTRSGDYANASGDAAPLFVHEAGQVLLPHPDANARPMHTPNAMHARWLAHPTLSSLLSPLLCPLLSSHHISHLSSHLTISPRSGCCATGCRAAPTGGTSRTRTRCLYPSPCQCTRPNAMQRCNDAAMTLQ